MLTNRSNLGISCQTCNFAHLCLPAGLTTEENNEINSIIKKELVLGVGTHLYHTGSKTEYLYAVYSGICKDYSIDAKGNEYINNFYLPGDILGLESIPNKTYLYSAVTLTKCEICVIPLNLLLQKTQQYNNLNFRLLSIMAYKIQNDKQIRLKTNAKQRVADFLLNMYRRFEERQKIPQQLYLPMSQQDISNLLGIAFETLNRILHDFANNHIIQLIKKEIHIMDIEALKKIGSEVDTPYGQFDYSGNISV